VGLTPTRGVTTGLTSRLQDGVTPLVGVRLAKK
jgi:hypothetical protein